MYTKMRKHGMSIDQFLLLAVLILIGIGCFFIYDFTVIHTVGAHKNVYLLWQLMYAVCGLCVMIISSRIDYHHLSQLIAPAFAVVFVFNVCVHIVGPTGYIRWQAPYLLIGSLDFNVGQATEFVVLIVLAQLIARTDLGGPNRHLFLLLAALVCFLPMLSFDLKSTLILVMTWCLLLLLLNPHILSAFLGCALILTLVLFHLPEVESIFRSSLSVWLDPFSDFYGDGYAAIQSMYAFANGGIFGVGIGHGMMRYAIEDVHSTFIMPAITEEIGLVGAAIILLVYLFLLMRMFVIAARAVDRWGFYLAAAIMARFSVRLILSLALQINQIPRLKDGLLLPFLSYGGTALMLDCFLIGILLSIGRYHTEPEVTR